MDKNNLKIMVINRSQMLRTIIRDALRKNGFTQITSSDSGITGLRLAKASPPDLVIVDFSLSDMDGLTLLDEVRKDRTLRDTAVVMISSEPERQKVAVAAERRVNAFVVKPFSQQTLLEKVNLVLERQLNPAEGVACYRQANNLVQQGDVDGALELYRQALNATGYSMAAVYHRIGCALEDQGRDDDAETNYQYAVDRSRRFVDAYDALGGLNLKNHRHSEAARFLKQGVDLSPLNAERQLKLGEALFELGDFAGAEKAYKRSLKLDPIQETHIFNRLGITMRRLGNMEAARNYFLEALKKDENQENLHYNLGQVYRDIGDETKAREHLEKALEINPDFEEPRELLRLMDE